MRGRLKLVGGDLATSPGTGVSIAVQAIIWMLNRRLGASMNDPAGYVHFDRGRGRHLDSPPMRSDYTKIRCLEHVKSARAESSLSSATGSSEIRSGEKRVPGHGRPSSFRASCAAFV